MNLTEAKLLAREDKVKYSLNVLVRGIKEDNTGDDPAKSTTFKSSLQ